MKRLLAAIMMAIALIIPVAVTAETETSCVTEAEWTERYGYSPQEYVNRVALAEITLAAEQASIKAVAAGNQTIDRWSPAYGEQMGVPALKYADLYFQARMVEFRDGAISFPAASSYLGPTSIYLIQCNLVDGEAVRASLQGVEAVVIEEPVVQPPPRNPSPALQAAIVRLRGYIANLERRGNDPDKLALYKARLLDFLAR